MWSLSSSLQPEQWTRVKDRLIPVLKDYADQAERAVKTGKEQVYRLGDTVMLLRGERAQDGQNTLVVVALAGRMDAGTLGAVNHARAHGFDAVRAHFSHRGAYRYIKRKLMLPVREIETRPHEHVLQIRLKDMGGSSKSASTNTTVTSTTNKSLSQAVGGDNTGVMLSGIEDADINLTMTDMGAMAVAGHMAEEAFAFGTDTLNTHEALVRDVLDVGVRALTTNTETSQQAMDAMQSLAGQQHATTQAAIHLAEGAKAREQTGATDSNNTLLKNVSLMVGVVGTIITVVYLLRGSH